MTRPLYKIAADIITARGRGEWPAPGYATAKPYINAMASLDSINDRYGCDSGRSIVLYFLANASTWRGDNARRIKSELKEHLK